MTFPRRNAVLNRLRVIHINPLNWKLSSCSCGHYLKNYSCKHIICVSEKLRKCVIPDNAKVIPLGQKRQRGRPARTNTALLHQQDEQVSSNSSDASETDTSDSSTMASPELNMQRTALVTEVETAETNETAETTENIAGTSQSIFLRNKSADPRLSAINRGRRGSRGRRITIMPTEVYHQTAFTDE